MVEKYFKERLFDKDNNSKNRKRYKEGQKKKKIRAIGQPKDRKDLFQNECHKKYINI